ncbi:MAG: TetR/AcrR family transcriptional regulator [Spirochaetales bacterium]|nr:MAG: TetR/AcrR family transcriptional regulator [Spirochaetales bacterium]
MSAIVEHEKRKKEILEKALDVFVEEGYADTTFQKIADRCGITRTILYLYFKNKREIFTFSIKRFTEKLEESIRTIVVDDELASYEKLERVVVMTVQSCVEHARLLSVIMAYLTYMKRSGGNTAERVRRRTIRMRHIIAGVVISGQKKGELARVPLKPVTELFYALIEAAIFRVTMLDKDSVEDLCSAARLFINRLKT